ncbi:hypothetical protein [Persephonella sp. KM09-Lau-8]|uniref:hypothetical protein n=1 Tax=Persephonella sp. KM09-Lau-8 TaxID=1158345 RepID=UPI0006906339|nr:hypothetical protein [Persephonella sp. KM09-Lau-8]
MKRISVLLGIILFFSVTFAQEFRVLIVYSPKQISEKKYAINALESVLQEEGILFSKMSANSLLTYYPEKIKKIFPVIVFPDGVAQQLPDDIRYWSEEYVNSGGHIFVIYDAGVKDIHGHYRNRPLFDSLVGVNYCLYPEEEEKTYTLGYFKLNEFYLKDIDIPPGKTIDNTISGYKYGKLKYPVALTRQIDRRIEKVAYVYNSQFQGIGASLKRYGEGSAFFVNLPLCHLKAESDDLLLRAFIRFYLFRIVHLPHLLNVPYGKGGLIINWHIDSYLDWKSIPMMIKKGYLKKTIIYSNHITAGPFLRKPGDGKGFDACGRGKRFALMLTKYGITGSHGGWAHNWFARNILTGKFGYEEIKKYIKKNNECLQKITHQKIEEYSAPNGVHPQPIMTKALEELGMKCYYYTGDSGSAPNRTFYNKEMVSDKVWAFPVTPLGDVASFYEMAVKGYSSKKVEKWLKAMVDFVIDRKTIRLIYSHPYDIPHYPKAILRFINYAEKKYKQGKLIVKPMLYFENYLERFVKTQFSFETKGKKFIVDAYNSKGLKGIPIAIPKRMCSGKLSNVQDKHFYYIIITKNTKNFHYECRLR